MLTAQDKPFAMLDTAWDSFEGRYIFTSTLVAGGEIGTRFSLDAPLFRSLCGEILTSLARLPDAPATRDDLFRLALQFPIIEDGVPTERLYGDQVFNLPVEDGACPDIKTMATLHYNAYSGALRDWGLLDMLY